MIPTVGALAIAPFLKGASQATLRAMISILRPMFFFRFPGYFILHLNMMEDPYYLRLAAVATLYFVVGGFLGVAFSALLRGKLRIASESAILAFGSLLTGFVVSGLFVRMLY